MQQFGVSAVMVAYSGGVDSTALLYALKQLYRRGELVSLQAIHVNHQLQPQADQWAAACRQQCESWHIPLTVVTVKPQLAGRGVEAAAREARYRAFAEHTPPETALLTAHHRRDQAETVLLRLFRGAGVTGLVAMRPDSQWQGLRLLRPWLLLEKPTIDRYAAEQQLHWSEDPSNAQCDFERNYIRHQLLPELTQRYGAIESLLSRTAANMADSESILQQVAERDWAECRARQQLQIERLMALSRPRRWQLLRHWLQQLAAERLSRQQLELLEQQVIMARGDAMPKLTLTHGSVRRYRHLLWWVAAQEESCCPLNYPPLRLALTLTLPDRIVLPSQRGGLICWQQLGVGVALTKLKQAQTVELRWRRGGEAISLGEGMGRVALKKIYARHGVPPWQRWSIPLLYLDGELVQLCGIVTAAGYGATAAERGVVLRWEPDMSTATISNLGSATSLW
ncbi:tRNA lysidine(34) synthetase TilS [Ectothiorhodospiraceae bacterium BW-2]|nr:tRNA lysidine(34) synthetase TilS [Ectothiorhodospiraceae bacterium BW-2]